MGFIRDMLAQALDDATRDADIERSALLEEDITAGEVAAQAQLFGERFFGNARLGKAFHIERRVDGLLQRGHVVGKDVAGQVGKGVLTVIDGHGGLLIQGLFKVTQGALVLRLAAKRLNQLHR